MRRALGKGLSQLLGEQAEASGGLEQVSVAHISPNPRQPRREFDQAALEDLANSIRKVGVLQPLVVRRVGVSQYELIAGERRLRASKLAGLSQVPVVIRSAEDLDSLQIALIENVQREDIGPLECALAYRQLADEFGLSQEQIADQVGKSRTAITNTMRLLRLPQEIQDGVQAGWITEGHARALLSLEDEQRQHELFEQIVADQLSVREAERRAKQVKSSPDKAASAASKVHSRGVSSEKAQDQALSEALSVYFGSICRVERKEVGGSLRIDFYSEDDLTRILDILGVTLD